MTPLKADLTDDLDRFGPEVGLLLRQDGCTELNNRTMALIDLHKELVRATSVLPISSSQSSRRPTEALTYTSDDHTEKELTTNVLKLLVDPIGEVKNMAVSW
jgi:hypothetical protein